MRFCSFFFVFDFLTSSWASHDVISKSLGFHTHARPKAHESISHAKPKYLVLAVLLDPCCSVWRPFQTHGSWVSQSCQTKVRSGSDSHVKPNRLGSSSNDSNIQCVLYRGKRHVICFAQILATMVTKKSGSMLFWPKNLFCNSF